MLDSQTLITILTAGGTALVTQSISNGPANSLIDLWNGIIGHQIHAWSEKRKLIMNERFIPLVVDKISQIPDENIQEAKTSILGPIIEATRFYIDEEEMREMFANLIAASMDKSQNEDIHHSFSEIIKQLSPHDAKFLSAIKISVQTFDLKRGNDIFYRKFCIFPKFEDYAKNAISISNLTRLGLLDMIPYFNLENYEYKDFIFNHDFITELKQEKNFSMQPHTYVLSPLGFSFKNICMKNSNF